MARILVIEDKHKDKKESRESRTRVLNIEYVFVLYSLLIRCAETLLERRTLLRLQTWRAVTYAPGIIAK